MLSTFLHSVHTLKRRSKRTLARSALAGLVALASLGAAAPAAAIDLSQTPLFLTDGQAPLVLLTMARDHKLYFEAYNDYSDLNGDGILDVGYKPSLDYYGYFDSYKCYEYRSNVSPARFVPSNKTSNKKCSGKWSGDFLNYVTTSRMDALRKVLYGGSRKASDTSSLTVLERSYIPQDAHTWGKEYQSEERDGYNISDYTPLSAPVPGYFHLFANASLSTDSSNPVMRVLPNTKFRVWEWLSIERPVAGDDCAPNNERTPCKVDAAFNAWELVPAHTYTTLTQTVWNISNQGSLITVNSASDFNALVNSAAKDVNKCGTRNVSLISGNNNPFAVAPCQTDSDYYLNIFEGTITVPSTGWYRFAVDGDDAVDFTIRKDNTWYTIASYYGVHGTAGNFSHDSDNIYLTKGTVYPIRYRHQDGNGGDAFYLYWRRDRPASSITDYSVRVEVCNSSVGLESNCQTYTSGGTTSYKPVGLLQKQGNSMYFGLMTGSYTHNTQGGVMRKGISTINNEITPDGRFGSTAEICNTGSNCVNGIINTINSLKIVGFNNYSYDCGYIVDRSMGDGECNMWGNPLGEMVYEGMRYFAGKKYPTSAFTYSATDTSLVDYKLGLPMLKEWTNPYNSSPNPTGTDPTFAVCAKPYNMLISDVYPSFDSDSIPGNPFNGFTGDLPGMSMMTLGDTMWKSEFGTGAKNIFIGQSGSNNSGTPTAKSASSFGNIRGLAPGEPTRQGSYSAAAAAYYGHITSMNPVATEQKVSTYSVALAAPLPTIDIPVGSGKVTFMPFAKSVGGFGVSTDPNGFQPTNQIVDFYIDTIRNTAGSPTDNNVNGGRPYYKFRINYEDQEQGADFDMDAIGLYEIKLNADNTVTVSVSSDYAAGSITQHMGFTIAGTSADGAYLVVRDSDTGAGNDYVYKLDCRSNTSNPKDCGTSGTLPLYKELKFTPSESSTTTQLRDPLWYAAKWGGYTPGTDALIPDKADWDSDNDGVPDTYFLVTNPTTLEVQLTKAFAKISEQTAVAASTAANSFSYQTTSALYQARFSSAGWTGELGAYPINKNGTLGTVTWKAEAKLAAQLPGNRTILTYDPEASAGMRAIPFRWASMTSNGVLRSLLNKNFAGTTDALGSDRVSYLRGNAVTGMRTRPVITGTSTVNRLGDIVSSQPQYVTYPSAGFGSASYTAFRTDYLNREAMVYVGANDGMLHGFSAVDGTEKLAYVPSQMYRTRKGQPLLSKLTASNYGQLDNPHNYYVDGTLSIFDICAINCAARTDWKTIAVGGLNAGGQGIYALNVTDPTQFSESAPAKTVMWEFNDYDDTDSDADMRYGLGYTFSKPAVVQVCTARVASSTTVPKACTAGRWVVIFGNGYNNSENDGYASSSGHAILYVLDANTGAVIRKINTKAGSGATPNGLATTGPIDVDNDGYVDYVYAGDLLGNMWKFDLSDASSANWRPAFGTVASPLPLFTAVSGGKVQPITTAPDALLNPDGGSVIVFGTGSYIATGDKAAGSQQTMYGLRDTGSMIVASSLTQQSMLTGTADVSGVTYRAATSNTLSASSRGWYMNLPDTGERVAYDPRVIGKVLAFSSTVPTGDMCSYGGTGWDYYIDGLTGGNLGYTVLTDSGTGTLKYTVQGNASFTTGFASSRKSNVGITPAGTLITQGGGLGTVILSGSTGNAESYNLSLPQNIAGRVSWREIITD